MKYQNSPSTLDTLGRVELLTAAPLTDWTVMAKSEHFVQFYESDSFLIRCVGGFVTAGLRKGENAVVIGTRVHREALNIYLIEQGLDPRQAEESGQFYALDAEETLAKFMVEGAPDKRLFNHVVGGLVARATAGGQPLRAFGEMVALLHAAGNTQAAIELENLWNDLAKVHEFSLFCAYPMGEFCGEAHAHPMAHICKTHTRVIPAESYTANTTAGDRLQTITLLQQKAASLEAEIARRKKSELDLARREQELTDFLENAAEGIHQVGPDGTILWANKAELQMLGYPASEYIGQNIRKFHADPEVIEDILRKLSSGVSLHDYEARLRRKDGTIRFAAISSSVRWQGDKFGYTRCFTRDITERKLAEVTLENTVAERTAQLRETVAELEAFSYSISHDMRSPLRAMQGYAKALLEDYGDELKPEAIDSLQRIHRGANRLDMLVRDVLAYSKVAKGDIDLHPIALKPLLDDLIYQNPSLNDHQERIHVAGFSHTVLAHEACLTQCFTNLIENALKFSRPGVDAQVSIISELIGGNVRISIRDNGIGIAPEHYDRIFQIFGRVHPEKRFPGTGIGLAVVKKAVTRMGGQVGFDSQPGKGSTFWFLLPHVP
jgi:PAS domain S-box-containing protein